MSHDAPGPRPRQVTVAGWLIAVTSAVLVVSVFDTMANLHSVDTRDRLTSALTTGSLKDLGISVADALRVIRGALFVAGVAAVVTGILGVFVLQRHASARIVLTVAAVPVVITAPFAGGVLGLLIGGATGLLWTREARDWFAGRPPARPTPRPAARPTTATAPPPVRLPPPPPAAHRGGTPAERAAWAPPAPPGAVTTPRPAAAVPRELRLACWITWIFTAVTGIAYVVVVLAVALDRARVLDAARDNSAVRDAALSDSELVGLLVGVSAVVIAWCIVAAVLAALAWRRHHAAWMLLMVSAGVASLAGLFALPYSLPHLAACAATFVLLLRRSVRSWMGAAAAGAPGPGGAAGWPPPGAPQQPPPPPPDQPQGQPQGKPPVW